MPIHLKLAKHKDRRAMQKECDSLVALCKWTESCSDSLDPAVKAGIGMQPL